MKLQPLGDHVIVKPLESEEKTKSGIVLPDTAKEKPMEGEVIAVGPGRYEEGKKIPMEVKVGDKVIYSEFGGQKFKLEAEEYLILRESDILAIAK